MNAPAGFALPFPPAADERRAGGTLTVDLSAIAQNYALLRRRAAPAAVAGVVKADAYGLGVAEVAPALFRAGCRHFFVAHLEEALVLRPLLSEAATIAVLTGPLPGTEDDFAACDLVPVINGPAQAESWAACARRLGRRLDAILQVDSGMSRFGLSAEETRRLSDDAATLDALKLQLVMSHLACADDPGHPANAAQRDDFNRLRMLFPGVPASLAASSGIFLGRQYGFDMVRPGAALYGISPQPGANPMLPVVRLEGRVVQVRTVDAGAGIGYGHTAHAGTTTRLATVAVGYADGYLRSASNHGAAWFGEHRLPQVGRISMDSAVFDVSALGPDELGPGALVELIGPHQPVDAVAAEAGTIGYEILTSLGRRFHRRYVGG